MNTLKLSSENLSEAIVAEINISTEQLCVSEDICSTNVLDVISTLMTDIMSKGQFVKFALNQSCLIHSENEKQELIKYLKLLKKFIDSNFPRSFQ